MHTPQSVYIVCAHECRRPRQKYSRIMQSCFNYMRKHIDTTIYRFYFSSGAKHIFLARNTVKWHAMTSFVAAAAELRIWSNSGAKKQTLFPPSELTRTQKIKCLICWLKWAPPNVSHQFRQIFRHLSTYNQVRCREEAESMEKVAQRNESTILTESGATPAILHRPPLHSHGLQLFSLQFPFFTVNLPDK